MNNEIPLDIDHLIIRVYPDPILRKPAQSLLPNDFNGRLACLSEKMIDIMVKAEGIGLAAPQVGIPWRMIVVSVTGKAEDAIVLINPELSHLQGTSQMEEGCLSIPGIRGKVRRAQACTVKALDLEGNTITLDAADLCATVLQHETDHLNGTLFVDRLSTIGRLACRKGLKQLEQNYSPVT